MTREEKSLLLQDLCARLPYGVYIEHTTTEIRGQLKGVVFEHIYNGTDSIQEINAWVLFFGDEYVDATYFRPILRPLSSMTEEEKEELLNLLFNKEAKYFYINEKGLIDGKTSDLMKEGLNYPAFCPINIVLYTDWLNSHHFDYRNLIEKKLALEAPDNMYK